MVSVSEDDIGFWQKKAESYYHNYVLKNNTNGVHTETRTAEEIPF